MSAAECSAASTSNLPRSDSMDSMLGDSLLDPPQSLQKIPPKRYQSPSRCGSPSLEAPEHLLFGLPGAKRDSAYGMYTQFFLQEAAYKRHFLRLVELPEKIRGKTSPSDEIKRQ